MRFVVEFKELLTESYLMNLKEIIDFLIEADEAYFNGSDPILTDSEYDRLKKKAFTLDPSHEYFSVIGSDVRGGKIKLPYTMGSLDQIYENEIQDWLKKYNLINKEIIDTDKLDGISCMLIYRNGELEIAYSRGNGVEGADITRHVRHVLSVPKKLKEDVYMAVRGELIMSNSSFNEFWANEFKNPRNMVSGIFNRKESVIPQIEDVDFIAYEIVATVDTDRKKSNQLERLKENGFEIVTYRTFVATPQTDDAFLVASLKKARLESDYELDGIVLTANDIEAVQTKRNSVSLNPEHSCKFKTLPDDAYAETYVRAVHWEISKSGYLKPRVEVEPVDLFGTTVTFATGFHGKFIRDNKIGTGAKVKITKSGAVIPQIIEVLSPAPKTGLPSTTDPLIGDWGWSDTDVEIVLVDADNHPQVIFKQSLDFFESLKVELLKESSLRKLFDTFGLWDLSYNEIILTIADLKPREWEMAIGSNGIKSYNSLHRRLQKIELATLLGACKYMGIGFGQRKAKMLLTGVDENDVWDLSVDDIILMDGFDTTTAEMVVNGLPHAKKFVNQLIDTGYVTLYKEVQTTELSGLNIVMTGFRDEDLSKEIERLGGKVGSGVSKKTTHVLTYDTTSNSGKAKKARDLGIPIMTPEDFKDAFNL